MQSNPVGNSFAQENLHFANYMNTAVQRFLDGEDEVSDEGEVGMAVSSGAAMLRDRTESAVPAPTTQSVDTVVVDQFFPSEKKFVPHYRGCHSSRRRRKNKSNMDLFSEVGSTNPGESAPELAVQLSS